MEKNEFVSKINDTIIQQYIRHPNFVDVVFAAFKVEPVDTGVNVNGCWINVAGVDAHPIDYDNITIKNEDIGRWEVMTRVTGRLSKDDAEKNL